MSATIGDLVNRVFNARDIAHRAHFKTKRYGAHMALGDFYDDIIEAIDEIVEVYQGARGKLVDVPVKALPQPEELIPWLQSEVAWINANRDAMSDGLKPVQNLIDGLAAIYHRTVYKLVNLH